jgi:hypothetical protein
VAITSTSVSTYDVWARVTFEASRISAATAIALDRADVGTVHAINDFVADFVEVRTSVDLHTMSDAERLAYLEAHPPATLT